MTPVGSANTAVPGAPGRAATAPPPCSGCGALGWIVGGATIVEDVSFDVRGGEFLALQQQPHPPVLDDDEATED